MLTFSVLIVDDEVITRNGLKSHVNWAKLGFDTVLDSGNAGEALKMVEEHRPDIILSDVNMPGMNGIEMCKRIREIHPNCQILFLSGYSDKEYLMGAIALEAVDYVEKPIEISEVEEALQKACERQKKQQDVRDKMKRLLHENHTLTARRLIEKLILPSAKGKNWDRELAALGLCWRDMEAYAVVLFKLQRNEIMSLEQSYAAIREIFRRVSCLYMRKEADYMVLLCAVPKGKEQELSRALEADLRARRNLFLYCAVGDKVPTVDEMFVSYQSAVVRLQQMVFWNRPGILGSGSDQGVMQFDETIFDAFMDGLKQYKEEETIQAENQLYDYMSKQTGIMVSSVKGIYFRFVEALFRSAEFSAHHENKVDTGMVGMIWEKLHELESLSACRDYLAGERGGFFSNVKELADNNQTIIRIISYIQSHYGDADMGLEEIAENVYLSQNYLSGLFRKKMGKTITQYIVDVRMDKARQLLRDRALKLYDVAEQVGYKDANYFTKIFKKSVGITPSEYREKYDQ